MSLQPAVLAPEQGRYKLADRRRLPVRSAEAPGLKLGRWPPISGASPAFLMPESTMMLCIHRPLAVLILSGLGLAAQASDGAAGHDAAPAARPVAAVKADASGGRDAMDQLRQKLAERLGAAPAPESRSGNTLRVSNSGGDALVAKASPGGGHGAPRKARPSTAEHATPAADGHGDAHGAAHWAYQGAGAPEIWGQLKPEFRACAIGQRQSPIDIRGGIQVELEAIQFDYRATGFSVVDNGHTVQVNLPPGNAITITGRRYDLLQFHFHRPSEERVNGRQFDMVAHLVHKDPEGRLAVVAVLLERGAAQGLIQTVWNALPLEKREEVAAPVAIDLNQLLPTDRRYYTYMGSLTTPPCSEGVLWMVLKQPVQLSTEQIGIFSRLYPMNARPIQQAAGRLIKESN